MQSDSSTRWRLELFLITLHKQKLIRFSDLKKN